MSLKIRVITPDKIVWNTPAEEVVLPSTTGQLGILNDHAPLITALEIGVLRVKLENSWKPMILLGGFAEVENNEATILVNGVKKPKINDDWFSSMKVNFSSPDDATKAWFFKYDTIHYAPLNSSKSPRISCEATIVHNLSPR